MNQPKPFEISKETIWQAWQQVKSNAGSAGVDRQSIKDCEKQLDKQLYKLWNRMSSGCYRPPSVRGVDIPKANGGVRRLGIPTVMDRTAQTAVKLVLEPLIDPKFHANSFGYRPNRSAHDAIAITKARCFEYSWVLEFDIKGMFDSIPHDLIMRALEHHTREKWILLYVRRWLEAEMVTPDGQKVVRMTGTPQGGVVSPLLANLFMHYAFDLWVDRTFPELPWCRYADDGLVHCRSREEGEEVLEALKERLKVCGLQLNLEKTRLVYCQDGFRRKSEAVKEFTFLGFDFQGRNAKSKRTGAIFRSFQPAVSRQAMKRMRHHIKHVWCLSRRPDLNLEELAALINPVVQGWLNYYAQFYPSAMRRLCQYLNDAISRWARRKFKRLYRRFKCRQEYVKAAYDKQPKLFAHWKFQPAY